MLNNQVLRYQDVTGIGYLDGVIIAEDARALIEENGSEPDISEEVRAAYQATGDGTDEYACVRFREFLDAGRIKRVYDIREPDGESIQVSGLTIEEIDALMRRSSLRCEIDLTPFEVIPYSPNTVQGAKDLQAKLATLGFQASEKEARAWEAWILNLQPNK